MMPVLLILAQNAPVSEQIDTPLEYWFGALAAIALVMTWLWLWLKIRARVRQREQGLEPPETEA
jgi:hypothetical protein